MGSLDSVVRGEERLCEGKLCALEHRRKVSALCLLYKMYHRADLSMHEYLQYFILARNGAVLVHRGISFPSSMCQIILTITKIKISKPIIS